MTASSESEFSANQIRKVCAVWPNTTWADADTDQTILDSKVNNAARKGFCAGIKGK